MALLAEFDGTPSTKTRLSFNLSMGNCCRKLREEQPEPKSPIAILKRIGEMGNFYLSLLLKKTFDDITSGFFVILKFQQFTLLRLLQQAAEGSETVV